MRTLLAVLLFAGLAAGQDTRTSTLENGMKVIVQEDHAIPNVAMYFFYRIGSRNERPGTTGLSHFFEHMMFNGAKKYGPKQFDSTMDNLGGNNNAYTTPNVTVYTDWFPSAALETMFDLEADRIRDLAFDPKIIESERGVVYSERRSSVDNNNFGALRELAQATAFLAHPYHWPVIGWASDIESWSMDDLKAHFRMGYAPNNCVLVVVGDVTEARVMELARRYLEPIPRHEPPPPVRTKEPEQRGERHAKLVRPSRAPMQMVLYHVPESGHADRPALDLIGTLLTRGQSSRLYRRLVDREQLATAVMGRTEESLDPGVMSFVIQLRPEANAAAAEKIFAEEVDRLATTPVSETELRKAKNQDLADLFRRLKTIEGRANLLGSCEVFRGDHRVLYTADREIEAVTSESIARVARKYLTAKNRTIATLVGETQEVKQ